MRGLGLYTGSQGSLGRCLVGPCAGPLGLLCGVLPLPQPRVQLNPRLPETMLLLSPAVCVWWLSPGLSQQSRAELGESRPQGMAANLSYWTFLQSNMQALSYGKWCPWDVIQKVPDGETSTLLGSASVSAISCASGLVQTRRRSSHCDSQLDCKHGSFQARSCFLCPLTACLCQLTSFPGTFLKEACVPPASRGHTPWCGLGAWPLSSCAA